MAGIPETLKPLTPYMRLAKQFESRDPTVSYYCQMYVVQRGIKMDSKSPEGKGFLFKLMDSLEQRKKELTEHGNDAVSNDTIASAYIEEKALQLFFYADREDRNSNFEDKVIKSFYTASLLFEVLSQFGETSEEAEHQKKYAKWKATYLERCKRTGEQPVPGPLTKEGEEPAEPVQPPLDRQPSASAFNQPGFDNSLPRDQASYQQPGSTLPPQQPAYQPPPQPTYQPPPQPTYQPPPQPTYQPPPQPTYQPPPQQSYQPPAAAAPTNPGELLSIDPNQFQQLSYQQVEQVQKLCRHASSALNFQDFKTCLENLTKAMNLVRCGREG